MNLFGRYLIELEMVVCWSKINEFSDITGFALSESILCNDIFRLFVYFYVRC